MKFRIIIFKKYIYIKSVLFFLNLIQIVSLKKKNFFLFFLLSFLLLIITTMM